MTTGSQVVRGSVWFILAVGVGAAGSLAYWSVATRVDPIEIVSQGGFLFAALLFVNYATGMGLPVAVARFGPANTRSTNSLFNWALVYTAVTSLLGTLGFAVLAAVVLPDQTSALWDWSVPAGLTIFFLLAAGQSFAVLVEVRLVTMRLWGWVLGRVVLVSVLRMALFAVPVLAHTPIGLLIILAGTPGPVRLRRRRRPPLRPPTPSCGAAAGRVPPETGVVVRYASINYFAMLAAQAPQFVFPLIVGKYVGQGPVRRLLDRVDDHDRRVPHPPHGRPDRAVGGEPPSHRPRAAGPAGPGRRRHASPSLLTLGAVVFSGYAVGVFFGDAYTMAAEILPRMVAAADPVGAHVDAAGPGPGVQPGLADRRHHGRLRPVDARPGLGARGDERHERRGDGLVDRQRHRRRDGPGRDRGDATPRHRQPASRASPPPHRARPVRAAPCRCRRRPTAAVPVTKLACCEHRKATMAPKSSGSPMVPGRACRRPGPRAPSSPWRSDEAVGGVRARLDRVDGDAVTAPPRGPAS